MPAKKEKKKEVFGMSDHSRPMLMLLSIMYGHGSTLAGTGMMGEDLQSGGAIEPLITRSSCLFVFLDFSFSWKGGRTTTLYDVCYLQIRKRASVGRGS